MTAITPTKSKRGFAAMDPERQRAIARKGGESLAPGQRSFSQDRALAVTAGRKGGQNIKRIGGAHGSNRQQSNAPSQAKPAQSAEGQL